MHRCKYKSVIVIMLFFALFCTIIIAFTNATSVSIYPSDDSWVDFEFPDVNFGWQDMIHVMAGATVRRSYLKFDLSIVPPENVLTAVTLHLYCTADGSHNFTVNAHETVDNWNESNITWNNAPPVGTLVSSTIVGNIYTYYSWDITTYAQAQYEGDQVLSLVLKSPLDDPAGLPYDPISHRDFSSKEMSGTEYDPYLEITYEPIQYYLSVVSPYGVPAGEGWYESGSTAYAMLDTNAIDHGNGTRRVFVSWINDASGTDYAQSDPIIMDSSKTAMASWKTEYYLSVVSPYGVPAGEGWYESGSTAYASLDTNTIDHVNGTRRVFTSWSGDGSGSDYAQSDPIIMDRPKIVEANWNTQHRLTIAVIPNGVTTPSGEGWYDADTYASVSTDGSIEIITDSSRHMFIDWTTADISEITDPLSPSTTVLMDKAKTITANYKTQYYLTVISPYNSPTPTSNWFDAGTYITASVTSPALGSIGTRHLCTGWIGNGSVPSSGTTISIAFTIDEPSTITWNWENQYYLTVNSNPLGLGPIPGEGWYDESESVNLDAPYFFGFEFLHWDLDGVSQGDEIKQIIVDMDKPYTATANYARRPSIVGGSSTSIKSPSLPTWISLNITLIAAILTAAFWRKGRKDNY
ncbi:MAG: DNRLRE domain-containing protein [Candidatus Bathyarchaeota archaeon]|nr:MAG: DNRLRE domain-containing protein [Candidatus Bathyarchaeota archaeon]